MNPNFARFQKTPGRREHDESDRRFIRDKGGELYAPSEKYWLDAIARTGDYIFDPVPETFFQFDDPAGGIWKPSTKPEIRESVEAFVRNESAGIDANLDKILSKKSLDQIVDRMQGHTCIVRRDAFAKPPRGVILCENGRLEMLSIGSPDFQAGAHGRKEDLQTVRLPIAYDKDAKSEKLLTWLNRIFCGRSEDVEAIAKTLGAGLWGSSQWKKVVVIHGGADLGKSQIPQLAGRLIGAQKCAEFDTKRLGERFEMRRFVGKVLLRAADVDADFMTRTYADTLKQLTGFDWLRVEGKNSEREFAMQGDKLILATSNHKLRVRADVDRSAWETRLVYLEADGEPYSEKEQDTEYLDNLFAEEGPGVLNFALHGLRILLTKGWQKSDLQKDRVRRVMEQATNVTRFVREEIVGQGGEIDAERPGVTISEAWKVYQEWCVTNDQSPWGEQIFREMVKESVEAVFGKTLSTSIPRGGTAQRGWRGMYLRPQPVEEPVATFDPKAITT